MGINTNYDKSILSINLRLRPVTYYFYPILYNLLLHTHTHPNTYTPNIVYKNIFCQFYIFYLT